MQLKSISIDDINSDGRLRPVDVEHARALAFSIEKHGLINPITLRSVPALKGARYKLVAGAHRLWACRSLEWANVEAIIVQADSQAAEMIEISENFFRNDLSKIDRAAFGERFREIWEENVGPVSSRKPRDLAANLAAIFHGRFEDAVAKRLGLSLSAARRLNRIATGLHPGLRVRLRGTTHADNETLLLKLAKMPLDDQARIAAALNEGADIKFALKLAYPDKGRKDETQRREEIMLTTWSIMSEAQRQAFLESVGAMMKPLPSGFDLSTSLQTVPAPGNASPLRDWAAEPRELIDIRAAREHNIDLPPMPRKKAIPEPSEKQQLILVKLSTVLREKLYVAGGQSNSELLRVCAKLDIEHQGKMAAKLWRRANIDLCIAIANKLLKEQEEAERAAMNGTKAPIVTPLKRGPFKGLIPSLANGFLPEIADDVEFMTALRALSIADQEQARVLLMSGLSLDAVQNWARKQARNAA